MIHFQAMKLYHLSFGNSMQTFDILNIIMNKTKYIETGTSTFMIAQILLSAYTQVLFYYKLIQSRDLLQKIFACILPAWLIAGWCAMMPFTFGSFVNGGIRGILADKLITAAQTDQFMSELVVVAVVYVAVMGLYLFIAKPTWFQVLLTFGMETAMLVFSLTLLIQLYNDRSLLNNIGLTPFFIAVYSYFMVIYKTMLTMSALLAAAIFHERGKFTSYNQQPEFLSDVDFERYTVKFLNQHQKLTSLTFAVTITIMESFLTFGVFLDNGLPFSLKNIIISYHVVPGLIILLAGLLVWMFYLLLFAFFPKLNYGYRTLKQDSRMFELFYREVVQSHRFLPTGKEFSTKHFTVKKNYFFIDVIIKHHIN